MKQLNWYQIFGNTHNIPDGRTVTPTDDIQIWLNCADIWDKTYTTLAEVLADTDTLLALITSNNAVDYMVRSTTWAAEISVPELTGVTDKATGVADAWKAFQTNESNGAQVAPGDRVIYEFDNPICVIDYHQPKVSLGLASATYTYKIQGSNDKVTWNDLETDTVANWVDGTRKVLATSGLYRYVALYCVSQSGGSGHYLLKLNFYSASITADATAMTYIGQNNYCANTLLADETWCEAIGNSTYFESVLNVKVPTMTSNTTPYGECFGSTPINSSYPYWKAFDGDDNTCASLTSTPSSSFVGYKFVSAVKIVAFDFLIKGSGSWTVSPIQISYSDDGVTYTDVSKTFSGTNNVKVHGTFGLHGSHQYWKANRTTSAARQDIAHTVQFYGRKDV